MRPVRRGATTCRVLPAGRCLLQRRHPPQHTHIVIEAASGNLAARMRRSSAGCCRRAMVAAAPGGSGGTVAAGTRSPSRKTTCAPALPAPEIAPIAVLRGWGRVQARAGSSGVTGAAHQAGAPARAWGRSQGCHSATRIGWQSACVRRVAGPTRQNPMPPDRLFATCSPPVAPQIGASHPAHQRSSPRSPAAAQRTARLSRLHQPPSALPVRQRPLGRAPGDSSERVARRAAAEWRPARC